jgi:hypothetical protein
MLSENQEYLNTLNKRIGFKDALIRLRRSPDFQEVIEKLLIKDQTEQLILKLNEEAAFTVPGHKESTIAHLTAIAFIKSFLENVIEDGENAILEKEAFITTIQQLSENDDE